MKKSFAYIKKSGDIRLAHCKAEIAEQHECKHFKADGGTKKRCYFNGYHWECFSCAAQNELAAPTTEAGHE